MNSRLKKFKFKNQRQRVIAVFCLMTFLNTLVPYNAIYANTGPQAPEVGGFEPVEAPDMVNMLTGDLTYVLPVMNVPSPEGNYPLTLNYHAGITLDQEPSWAGLGWSLNPGVINRTLNGSPDDFVKWPTLTHYYGDLEKRSVVFKSIGVNLLIASYSRQESFVNGKSTGGANSYGVGYAGFSLNVTDASGDLRHLGGASVGFNVASIFLGENADKYLNIGVSVGTSGASASFGVLAANDAIGADGKVTGHKPGNSLFGVNIGREWSGEVSVNVSTGVGIGYTSRNGGAVTLAGTPLAFNTGFGDFNHSQGLYGKTNSYQSPMIFSLGAVSGSYSYHTEDFEQDDFNWNYTSGPLHFDYQDTSVELGQTLCKYTVTNTGKLNLTKEVVYRKTNSGFFYVPKKYNDNGIEKKIVDDEIIPKSDEIIISEYIKKVYPFKGELENLIKSLFYVGIGGITFDTKYDYDLFDSSNLDSYSSDISEYSFDEIVGESDGREANIFLPNYDHISVSAQGLMGSITPRMSRLSDGKFNETRPFLSGNKRRRNDGSGGTYRIGYYKLTDDVGDNPGIANPGATTNPIIDEVEFPADEFLPDENYKYFFNEEYSSALDVKPATLIGANTAVGNFLNAFKGNNEYDFYQKRSGKYVETFEMGNLVKKVLRDLDGKNISFRNIDDKYDNFLFPVKNGMPYSEPFKNYVLNGNTLPTSFWFSTTGAYRVTNIDGTTYHYSLPVYNDFMAERSYDFENKGKAESDEYLDRINSQKYATHWLLTAITGPDYIDKNNNHIVDEEDYGYWMSFEYDLYEPDYGWKFPKTQEEIDEYDTYSVGKKEIYYLDKVKSRTHTALFLKSERNNYKGDTYNFTFKTGGEKSVSVNVDQAGKLFKLDEILLMKNDKYYNVVDNEISDPSGVVGDDKELMYYKLSQLSLGDTSKDSDVWEKIRSASSKSVRLTYDLEETQLKSVGYFGNGNPTDNLPPSLTMPPYKFDYYNNSSSPSIKNYAKYSPQSRSLKKITTPLGANLEVVYEDDKFDEILVERKRVFPKDLKFYLYKDGNELKCKIQKADNHRFESGFTFTDYFQLGKVRFKLWRAAIRRYYYDWECRRAGGSYKVLEEDYSEITSINSTEMIIDISQYQYEARVGNEPGLPLNKWFDASDNGPWFEIPSMSSCSCISGCNRNAIYKQNALIYGNKKPKEDNYLGLGVRVKSITVSSPEDNYHKKETYAYENGVISFIPYDKGEYESVSYLNTLPSPYVMYGKVTKEDFSNNKKLASTDYEFTTLDPVSKFGNKVSFGPYLSFETNKSDENIYVGDKKVKVNQSVINNRLSYVGQLKSRTIRNPVGNVLDKLDNYYKMEEPEQGYNFESYRTGKYVYIGNDNSVDWLSLSSVYNKTYPLEVEKTVESSGGFTVTSSTVEHDYLTGLPTVTKLYNSNGVGIKTTNTYAYEAYYHQFEGKHFIGSKSNRVYNLSKTDGSIAGAQDYKNMLSQIAKTETSIIEVLPSGEEKEEVVSANITTWKDEVIDGYHFFKKHREYVWNGAIDPKTGYYVNYENNPATNFNWSLDKQNTNSPWKNIATYTKYNKYSHVLESEDLNGNYATTKFCDRDSKTLLVCNAAFNDAYYVNAEYDSEREFYVDDNNVLLSDVDNTKFHTGESSLKSKHANKKVLEIKLPNSNDLYSYRTSRFNRKYKVSVWVNKEQVVFDADGEVSSLKTKLLINSNEQVDVFKYESLQAGDWVLLNGEIQLPLDLKTTTDIKIELQATEVGLSYDDFRFYPIVSNMTGYVYDEWDRLNCIVGDNGLSTRYIYHESGDLKEVHTEVIDFKGPGTGGFKLSATHKKNYKK